MQIFSATPDDLVRDPGETFSLSFFIQNESSHREEFVPTVKLPKFWMSIPPVLPTLTLDPGQRTMLIFAIKIPSMYSPGDYDLELKVQGTKHPELVSSYTSLVKVVTLSNVSMKLDVKSTTVSYGSKASVKVTVENNGNAVERLKLNATHFFDEEISIKPSSKFTLEPSEKKTLSLEIPIPKVTEKKKDFLGVTLENLDSGRTIVRNAKILELTNRPEYGKDTCPYRYIPSASLFVLGFENNSTSLFINTWGGGFVDKKQTKHISYLFQVPIKRQNQVFTALGGMPERYFINYKSPWLDLYGGDGSYTLSPLVLNGRYGKGGMATLKSSYFKWGALGVAHSSAVPHSDWGTYLSFSPGEYLSVQGTGYHSHGRIISEEEKSNINIASVSASSVLKDYSKIQGEFAHCMGDKKDFMGRNAYLIFSSLKYKHWVWGSYRKVYAAPNYLGYFKNQLQENIAGGCTVYPEVTLSVSRNKSKFNLDKDPSLANANKFITFTSQLNFRLIKNFTFVASYNNFKSINRFTSDVGYEKTYGALRMFYNKGLFSFQMNGEIGKYDNFQSSRLSKVYQNYSLYTYYKIFRTTFGAYGKWGQLTQQAGAFWNNTYGAFLSYSRNKYKGSLSYEASSSRMALTRHYFIGKFNGKMKNGHEISINASIITSYFTDFTYRAMMTYTLPWGLPIGKDHKGGVLKGRVYKKEGEIIEPMANTIISCNERSFKTNKDGEFLFDHLSDSKYHLNPEEQLPKYITEGYYPYEFSMDGEEKLSHDIYYTPPGGVSGKISYYQFNESDEYELSHGAIANIELIAEKTREFIELKSNPDGSFDIPYLRPGKWEVRVEVPKLGYDHVLENPEFVIDVLPNEKFALNLRILPIKRSFKLL